MKKPMTLYAVVCEDGKVFVDEDNQAYVDNTFTGAEQYLDVLGHSGWPCDCKDHRIVIYEAKERNEPSGRK